jgi:hypothetical protein
MPHNNSNQNMKPHHRIIVFDIPGKKAARKLETDHIKEYEEKNGLKPKGNVRY